MPELVADGTAAPGEVWHFSEDPSITRFVPHRAATATVTTPYVWACSAARCPDYWFPRQTPRAMAWRTPSSDGDAADQLLGPGIDRLHVVEYEAVATMSTARLFAYRFDARDFHELEGFAQVSESEVIPLAPPVALASPWVLHRYGGIPVLVVPDLFAWWSLVIESDLGFSGIRLRNSPNHRRMGARD